MLISVENFVAYINLNILCARRGGVCAAADGVPEEAFEIRNINRVGNLWKKDSIS